MTEAVAQVAGQEAPTAGVQQIAEGVQPEAKGGAPEGGTAEVKPEGGAEAKPAEGEAKAGEVKDVVYELKVPEGIPVDTVSQTALVEIAKANKWSPEVAQQVVDLAVKQQQQAAAKFAAEVKGWETTVLTDPVLGGDNAAETLRIGRLAVDLGPPELKDLLSSTKMGSHPAVVKWMHAVGKMLGEDRMVQGGGGQKTSNDVAKALYPNQS